LSTTLSASRVTTIHGVLAGILDDAVRDRLLASNPARGVKLPRKSRRRNIYLTAEQLHLLATESGRYGSLVLLLGTVGLRWGEAAALRVRDVDFLRRRIMLHENAVNVSGTTHVGTLKGGRSRSVVVPKFVVDELSITCIGKERGELIWPAADGGYLPPPNSRSWMGGAVRRCQAIDPNFPAVTAHALRHTAASLAVSAGANVKVVQRMLGHTSAAMTLDVYADLFDDDFTAVAEKLSETVGNLWARGGGAAS
jgi:integrase